MDDIVTLGIRIDSLQAELAAGRMNRLANEGSKAEKSAAAMGAAFKVAAAGALLLGGAIYKILEKTSEFQVLNANLVTATGSLEGASRAFAALKTLATQTPFTLQEVTTAFTKLVNYGLTPSERAIRSYGDAAAATGKPIVSLVEGVADAVNGEFERVKEAFNVKAKNLGDTVAFRFRGVTTEVKNNAKDIEEYFIKLGETKFTGGMARQMDTLKGKMSNLGDAWDLALNSIGSGRLSEIAKNQLGAFTDKLNEITAWAEAGGFDALMYQAEAVASSQIPQWQSLGETILKVATDGAASMRILVEAAQDDSNDFDQYWSDVFTKFPSNINYMIQLGLIYFDDFMMRTEGLADQFKKVWGDEQFWIEVGVFSNPKTWFSWEAFNEAVETVDSYREALSKVRTEASLAAGYSPLGGGAPMEDLGTGINDSERQRRTQERIDKLNEDTDATNKNADAQVERANRMRDSLADIDDLMAELNGSNDGMVLPPKVGSSTMEGNPDNYNTDVPPIDLPPGTDQLAGFYQGGDSSISNAKNSKVPKGKMPKAKAVDETKLQAEYESELLTSIYEKEATNELEALDKSEERIRQSYNARRADILANTALTESQKAELIKRTDQQLANSQVDGTRKRNEAQLKLASEFAGNISTIAGAFGKKGHKIAQAAAIAKTLMETYSSATGAYSSLASIPYVGPALGIAAAGAAIAAGMANVQKIRSTEYVGAYAEGGIIPGNSPSGDRLSARVNSGEMILNQGQQRRLFDMASGGQKGPPGAAANVEVNIINHSGENVTRRESTQGNKQTVDIIVGLAIKGVNDQFRKGGTPLDRTMKEVYNQKRA